MKLKELHFLSDNLDETEAFYNTILGLKTEQKDGQSLSLYAGETLIVFNKSDNKKPIYHFAFDIPYPQFDEAKAWAEARMQLIDVAADSKISELAHWKSKSIYFYDNNGNLLEFIARADIAAKSTVPFSGNSILYVSEIGIVNENVPSKIDDLKAKYDIDLYAKQPAADTFTVLGDETGLLVNVVSGRNWFPTKDLAAKAFWMKIVFETEKGRHELIENK